MRMARSTSILIPIPMSTLTSIHMRKVTSMSTLILTRVTITTMHMKDIITAMAASIPSKS
jgi:hypothetical protein